MNTLGSLFDGIGGFPLAAKKFGIKTVWASEIESFPIDVTTKHFPEMKHLGDIRKIDGSKIEPVDIITFSSPCQDISVAGKQGGLKKERSGLFFEAIRVIREMRLATNGKHPRYAIWENVPGAFSSNKGQDFRVILKEITETEIPMPRSGRWANAGMVGGNECSVAWRVLDSQYFGVPQRRKRIFLLADFRGQSSPKILFEQEGLRGNFKEGRKKRKETPRDVGKSIKKCSPVIAIQGSMIGRKEKNGPQGSGINEDICFTLNTTDRHAVCFTQTSFAQYAEGVGTLRASGGDIGGGSENLITSEYQVRRLTPLECERLMGFPDNWTDGGSDTVRYKALGNSIAIPVVEWIFDGLFHYLESEKG